MVMASMNPLISSCLMLARWRSASTLRIWPCRRYTRSLERCSPHATATTARTTQKPMHPRILLVYSREAHDLDRHLRLQLSRMEGQLLSGGPACGEDAAVLRRPLPDGRNQLHVLPDAE